ncbi:hypothetical protein Forpi1262_v018252 [Fusarium oxysporum f. sp. raphani]|uniref:HTH CENPB-type domain-containing protein n=1 Tax=Fusarium oxysporum f. sp. raphani TaxID=96318 RepID=A0A8J5NLK8_FUSOX|nr:hypothetical protein Forpi1262_v018252 [Fusarium oxysporum f. sp. raphani]
MEDPRYLNPAVATARAILLSQRRHRNTKEGKPLTVREAAVRFKASKSAVGRHLKSMKLYGKPDLSDNSRGRPRNLDESEERAVTAYIVWLERAGFPCNQLLIEEAANKLSASRTPPEGPVSDGWYRRFLRDNPQLQKKKLVRAFDRERAGFEAGDIEDLQQFYTDLGVVVGDRDIEASQLFNADECGVRIGALRERLEVVIVKKILNTKHKVVAFSNRESTTMLECANAAGFMVPPLIVFKTWPTESWDVDALDEAIRFARSETGFPNAEITMDWIRHFNRNSFECTAKAQSRGITFTDWFGCDEFMRDIDMPDFIWKEPKLNEIIREGFTPHNIMNGFEKSGIFPVNGKVVIQKFKEKKKSLLAVTNPAFQSLLPKETRFKDVHEVSRHLKRNYRDGFSSPTRHSFGVLDDVICEAVVLNSFAEEHIQNRLQRITTVNNRKNKRKKVMPTGQYINSVTVEQIRESLAASTKKDQEEEIRCQRRSLKQLRKEEDNRLKEEWKKNYKYDINNNGKPIHISFERWKKWKQLDMSKGGFSPIGSLGLLWINAPLDIYDEIIYIPPPSQEASPTPEEGFFYDTNGSAQQQRFYERLRDATAAGFYRSPLQDIPAVPSSDGVEISLGNSQRDTVRDSLTFGDSDDSEVDEEGPDFVDLSQDIEEPELPPLPPPPALERNFSSTYHKIMNTLHPQRHTQ